MPVPDAPGRSVVVARSDRPGREPCEVTHDQLAGRSDTLVLRHAAVPPGGLNHWGGAAFARLLRSDSNSIRPASATGSATSRIAMRPSAIARPGLRLVSRPPSARANPAPTSTKRTLRYARSRRSRADGPGVALTAPVSRHPHCFERLSSRPSGTAERALTALRLTRAHPLWAVVAGRGRSWRGVAGVSPAGIACRSRGLVPRAGEGVQTSRSVSRILSRSRRTGGDHPSGAVVSDDLGAVYPQARTGRPRTPAQEAPRSRPS